MTDTKARWASKTVWATLIMLLSVAIRGNGSNLGPLDDQISSMILEVITVAAAVVGLWGRITASKKLSA